MKRKILVVDADPAWRRRLRGLYEHHGHIVECAANAVDAVRLGLVLEPHVIVTGWELDDDTHGLHVAEALTRHLQNPHVVFIADEDAGTLESACRLIGAHEFLDRDASPATLVALAEQPSAERPKKRMGNPSGVGMIAALQSTGADKTVTSAPATHINHKAGSFNYLDATVGHSLYRNGEVLTRRDPDGNDAGTEGVHLEAREMAVHDGRSLQESVRRTVEKNGFELLARPMETPLLDFLDNQQVVRRYYGECARIVQEATGASHVFAFDHNIRSASGEKSRQRIAGGQQVQGPAHVVHGDYTLTSGPQRLRDLARPPTGNDTLRCVLGEGQSLIQAEMVDRALDESGRFAIINLWRNIAHEPVVMHPLALCDAQSVEPEDLVVFEIHYADRIGENYFAKYSPRHRWYYYPGLTRDEALLIKQWDCAGTLARTNGGHGDASNSEAPCTFSFHSAFEDPTTPVDAPDRWSIEVRCIVLYA